MPPPALQRPALRATDRRSSDGTPLRPRAIGYVLMGYPRLSETFIASEILRLERTGVPLRLFVVKPVEDHERGLRNPVVEAVRTQPTYLPDPSDLTLPLHQWRPRHLRAFLPAIRRTARRRPRGFLRAVAGGVGWALRDRRTRWSGPRKIHVKELLQAIALADALLDAPEVAHLHAHFAHGTTTITWRASQIVGIPFSFTGHARDIYAPELNPHGLLRRKLLAADFAVTCTDANRIHLQRIAPEASIHRVYHGLTAEMARLAHGARPHQPDGGPLRVLGVGRLVAKKGFDVLVDACGQLRDAGVPVRARIVGQDGKHSALVRERIEALGLANEIELAGPMDQGELSDAYRDADVVCLPCRLLPNDRDGIPNVLVEAMACGTAVVSTAVSAIPELIDDGRNGLLVDPDDPAALAGALARLHSDPELAFRLAEAGRDTVRERFDGDRMAGELAAIFRSHALTAEVVA
jgi:glycosyltransferase involved in cell wall biosynthesis